MAQSDLLVFTENYYRGGSIRFMVDLINAAPNKFRKIKILTNKNALNDNDLSRLKRVINFDNIFFITSARYHKNISNAYPFLLIIFKSIIYFFDFFFLILNIFIFIYYLRKNKPRLVLACNGGYPASRACLALVLAAKFTKINVILSIVSLPTRRKPLIYFYEKFVDYLIWKAASKIIVNAKFISSMLSVTRGMPLNKAIVIKNYLENIDTKDTLDSDRLLTSKKKGISIGFVGRMDNQKGIEFLFEAFLILIKKHPNLTLVLAGSGNADKYILDKIESFSLQDRIILLGHFTGNINVLLSSFDIFVFPSLWEGLPYSILEAMRCGLPIVSTNVGGIPEVIKNRREGLLVNPGSTEDLVFALEELINDSTLRSRLGKNARSKFINYSTESIFHRAVNLALGAFS